MAGSLTDFGLGGSGRVSLLPCGFFPVAGAVLSAPKITTNSGACVANTWKTVLSVSGAASRLNALILNTADATARTIKLRITIDGVVVFDAAHVSVGPAPVLAVGQVAVISGASAVFFQPVDAASSLLVEYQSNLSETDKVTFTYNYEVR